MSAPGLAPIAVGYGDADGSVRSLDEPLALHEVGGKAFHLSRALALGLPVPAGVVITNAVFEQLMDDRAPGAETQAIDEGFRRRSIPKPVRQALRAWLQARRPGTQVVVRSSAVGEDSGQASFAGQLESRLNLRSLDEVEEAVLECWASYRSQRVLFYQSARNHELQGMGVVVQEQVSAAFAGVLFTRGPGAADSMLGEYCAGLADGLVSGAITPGSFVIGRSDGRWRRDRSPDEPAAGEGLLLRDRTMQALREMGLRLEQAFGAPQDIEWAIDGTGGLWCVQSRPITAPPATAGSRRRVAWSNANVSENFPAPISPLLYSIASAGYYHYFRNLCRALGLAPRRIGAMEVGFRNIIGVHGARMYYNLTSIHSILRAAPFGERLVEWFNTFTGAAEPSTPRGQDEPWSRSRESRMRQAGEVARMAVKTTWQYLFLRRRIERFEKTANAFGRRTHPDRLELRPLAELLDDLRGFLEIRCNRWTGASLADAAAMVCYGVLKNLLARAAARGGGSPVLHNTLLKALPDVVSGVPVIALWDLSRRVRNDPALAKLFERCDGIRILDQIRGNEIFAEFRAEFDDFLDTWGFRSSSELMLTAPSFQENPAPLIEIVKGYATLTGDSPKDVMRRHDGERVAETKRLLAALPLPDAIVTRIALRWTQRSIVYRERARLKQALLYSRCRRIALAIGSRLAAAGRLAAAEDIFFLSYQEIDALGSGTAMFPDGVRPLVELRRAEHARLSAMCPPDAFTLPEGESWAEAGVPAEPDGLVAGTAATLTGTGACGGHVTGSAAVLDSVAESHRVRAGDLLVTRQTDPGWAPVFFLIKGLVIERGGMLSHGAILAREFGLPCVVGAAGATRAIAPGQTIVIDGDKGEVRLGACRGDA